MQPPPAPVLDDISGDVLQNATGAPDEGGKLYLFASDDGSPPWRKVGEAEWEAVHLWGDWLALPYYALLATERGNGLAYSGSSMDSNVLTSPM